jgi:hypothetical protein
MDEDHGRVGQRLDQGRLGEAGAKVVGSHAGQVLAVAPSDCKVCLRPFETFGHR